MHDEAGKTNKGERTRRLILESALELFRERGYEQATMRAVASSAGVSLGNAYYYFKSKEHLIQAYYARSHDEHLVVCEPILEGESDFKKRLHGLLRTKIDASLPYHAFAAALFKTAADPKSPLNPFSDESRTVRDESTALFGRALSGSSTRVTGKLAAELPGLLWTYQMGIILFWIHDTSPGCARSYKLIDRTVDIVVRLIGLARLPVMRPLVNRTLGLMKELRDLGPQPAAGAAPAGPR